MDTGVALEQGTPSEKEQRWEQTEQEIADLEAKDPHGLTIDPKVKRTVIGLNVLGINTTMSCEGHLDHGRGAPHVEIAGRESGVLNRAADEAYIMQRHVDYERLREQALQINKTLHEKLQTYLDEFYADQETPQQTHLIAELTPYGKVMLKHQGESLQQTAPSDEKSTNLFAFQSEMEAFGDFLEKKFFGK